MFPAPSLCALQIFLVTAATALYLSPVLTNAIVQSAHVLNTTHIPIASITPANSGYDPITSAEPGPELNLTSFRSLANDKFLKNTQVHCSRPAYDTVTHQSCQNALSTLTVRPSHVYTFGQRDAGLFDIGLPFRLLSSNITFHSPSSKPTFVAIRSPWNFI